MKLTVNKERETLYLQLDESKVIESEEIQPGVILDFDQNGRVVGVEFLNVTSRMSDQALSSLLFHAR